VKEAVACVAGLPAVSLTLAVILTVPSVRVLSWAEVRVMDQAPPAAMVAVCPVIEPTATVTVRPSAPEEVPEIVSEDSSSTLLTKLSVEIGVVIARVGAVMS
jgi:hypothetical protein